MRPITLAPLLTAAVAGVLALTGCGPDTGNAAGTTSGGDTGTDTATGGTATLTIRGVDYTAATTCHYAWAEGSTRWYTDLRGDTVNGNISYNTAIAKAETGYISSVYVKIPIDGVEWTIEWDLNSLSGQATDTEGGHVESTTPSNVVKGDNYSTDKDWPLSLDWTC